MHELRWPDDCPAGPADVSRWASANAHSEPDAWRRLAHFLTAVCIARDDQLRPRVIVCGGVSLWLVYRNARTPGDFDLAVRPPVSGFEQEGIRQRVSLALRYGMPQVCPDFSKWAEKIRAGAKVRLNCFANTPTSVRVNFDEGWLDLIDVEFSLAQKVVAITKPRRLPTRGRNKDVFDFCYLLRLHGDRIDLARMAQIAREIAHTQKYPPPIADEQMRERTAIGYESIRESTGSNFIEFDEAWTEMMTALRRIGLAAD